MRKLLFILLLLVAAVVAVGFYRGWWRIGTSDDPETGRGSINLEIDRNKIKPDLQKAGKAVGIGGGAQTTEAPKQTPP